MRKKRPTSGLLLKEQRYAYGMIAPVVLGFLCFILFQLLYEFYMSCTNMTLTDPGTWVGLENYRTLVSDPKYVNSMEKTMLFMLGIVPLNILAALVLAQMLSQKLRGVGLFRTLVFIPYITPVIVWAQVWKLILSSDAGILNAILSAFGIQGRNWLFDMKLTMPVVILNYVLKNLGYNMIIFLSAMMSVPAIYYEAAELDGADRLNTFFRITLPVISPTGGESGCGALPASTETSEPDAEDEVELGAGVWPFSPLVGEMSGRTEGGMRCADSVNCPFAAPTTRTPSTSRPGTKACTASCQRSLPLAWP